MTRDATARQMVVLRRLAECIRSRGFSPTLRELGDVLGIYSTNGVADHLEALERKGYLTNLGRYRKTFSRCWSLTSDGWALLDEAALTLSRRPATHTLVEPSKCPLCGADTFAAHPPLLCVELVRREAARA